MSTFDLLGPLPAPGTTTVLEASAGTGKTFALAGLVTRYIAEGVATLDQMLLITFSRAATQELRERVRRQIAQALAAFGDPGLADENEVVRHLLTGTPTELAARPSTSSATWCSPRSVWPGTATPASSWSRALMI